MVQPKPLFGQNSNNSNGSLALKSSLNSFQSQGAITQSNTLSVYTTGSLNSGVSGNAVGINMTNETTNATSNIFY
jgi:hypothetical protein